MADRILSIEALPTMTAGGSVRRSLWTLWALAAVSLLVLGACAETQPGSDARTTVSWQSTIAPQAAATLTAWPTPPALATRPPTPTTAPQPLWTAVPQGKQTATPVAPIPPTQPLGAPLGSMPPPVRLLIPRLGIDVPVVEVSWSVVFENGSWRTEWETAEGAAGHHRDSANPGEAGNMILSGHHNTKGEVFRLVSEIGQPGNALSVGDSILVVAEDGREYAYEVMRWDRFQEDGADPTQVREHARYLAPTQSATLTLVTCWPYESNSHRVVVVAELRP